MLESIGWGEMAERFKAAVSKTVVGASSTVGSNPTLSAIMERCRSGRTGTTGNRVG